MTFLKALWSPSLRWMWGLVVVTCPLLVLFDYLAVAPVGSKSFLLLQIPFILLSVAAFGVVIVLPFIIFWSSFARELMAWWLACAVFLAAAFLGTKYGYAVRMSAFGRLAERSSTLVEAIEDYEKEHGSPPGTLEALVPKHLPSVPGTGMAGYPKYVYQHGPEIASRYTGNSWILSVRASKGVGSFDEFLYFPLQNYPEKGFGGRLERMRDWAYLHE